MAWRPGVEAHGEAHYKTHAQVHGKASGQDHHNATDPDCSTIKTREEVVSSRRSLRSDRAHLQRRRGQHRPARLARCGAVSPLTGFGFKRALSTRFARSFHNRPCHHSWWTSSDCPAQSLAPRQGSSDSIHVTADY